MSTESNDGGESRERLRASELRRALDKADAPWGLDDGYATKRARRSFRSGELPPDAPQADRGGANGLPAAVMSHHTCPADDP